MIGTKRKCLPFVERVLAEDKRRSSSHLNPAAFSWFVEKYLTFLLASSNRSPALSFLGSFSKHVRDEQFQLSFPQTICWTSSCLPSIITSFTECSSTISGTPLHPSVDSYPADLGQWSWSASRYLLRRLDSSRVLPSTRRATWSTWFR